MTEQKCKWTTEPPKHVPHPHPKGHDCPESTLKGYDHCILHSDKTKDPKSFLKKVKKRINTKANVIDLRGIYFPRGFDNQYFKEKKFAKPVFFNETTFCGKVDFSGAKFLKGADFYGTKFSAETSFDKTVFEGFKTNFREAKFEGDIYFFDTQFRSEEVSFTDTEFSKRVEFNNPYFYGRAYFIRTEFKERCWFGYGESSAIQQPIFQATNLSKCSFLDFNINKFDFRYCEFAKRPRRALWFDLGPRENVLRDELDCDDGITKDYEPVRRLYLELKRNFEDKKDWNTAGDFHYGEMECRRKGRLGGWLDRFLVNAYYLASGYGERPWRAFIVLALLVLVAFPLLLSLNVLVPPLLSEQSFRFWNWVEDLRNSVGYSLEVATFTRVTRIGEALKVAGWDKWILVSESIVVYIQIALFALALRRKVKR